MPPGGRRTPFTAPPFDGGGARPVSRSRVASPPRHSEEVEDEVQQLAGQQRVEVVGAGLGEV